MKVSVKDKLYFVIDANENSAYDGGRFEITIRDRDIMTDENSITVNEVETRQNFASVKDDFGEQGNNGWFFQEGYEDEPFGGSNLMDYVMDEKYLDKSQLEIKRDFAVPGNQGKSAVIKWKAAQDGRIAIDADYTKHRNQDKNPSWPDGTRVTLYHKDKVLSRQEFEPNTQEEVNKSFNIEELGVKRGEYITMVINGKENTAYDGANYNFAIRSLDKPAGEDENTVTIESDGKRTNNASVERDFGKQGNNGWFYQFGYYTEPFFAVNVANYDGKEKYTTRDGIEIKKDYIMPASKGKSANVKWKAAKDGTINILASYTKLRNEEKNPSWPDGTRVTLMLNDTVLVQQEFAPDTEREITKDMSQRNVPVKAGDYVTFIVDGKSNTAYDGGVYRLEMEDASKTILEQRNDSKSNTADLTADFGKQGSNGWYYLEGTSISDYSFLTVYDREKNVYTSMRESGFELGKDFVHPGSRYCPMYQWVAAKDGKINISYSYTKFGQEDPNPKFPDGVTVKAYLNGRLLQQDKAAVKKGDGNDTKLSVNRKEQKISKGDKITFMICSDENNAWDGGRFTASIHPPLSVSIEGGRDNNTSLANDFGKQGENGWVYGYGNMPGEFEYCDAMAPNADGAYTKSGLEGLEIKGDYVQPSQEKGAVYQWIAAKTEKITVTGAYTKFGHQDADLNWPDGTKVEIYLNDKCLWSKPVSVQEAKDTYQEFVLKNLKVKKDDKLSYIITAKKNNAWDGGRLMTIIKSQNEKPQVFEPGKDNETNLAAAFGKQGNDGWYYGASADDGSGFELLPYDEILKRYFDGAKPELKADFVEPGNGRSAAYKWIAAENGNIRIKGKYTKFANSGDENANGVTLSIYQNKKEKKLLKEGIYKGGITKDTDVTFEEVYTVSKGDEITFLINPKGNDSWDGGRLAVSIEPDQGKIVMKPGDDNNTDLAAAFGEQGSDGWYYGKAEWNGEDFQLLPYDAAGKKYTDGQKPELKADYTEPGNGKNAAYKWLAAEDGKIVIKGTYTKFANSSDDKADGVCLRIYQNAEEKKWLGTGINQGGITTDITLSFEEIYTVKAGDEITFLVSPEGNDILDGGKLEAAIAPYEDENPFKPGRDNITSLSQEFGKQGSDGWYYGKSDWDGANFQLLPYDETVKRYYDNGKPELKADFVEPAVGKSAAYKWIAAEEGDIRITGKYTKYPNSSDSFADGVTVRILQNDTVREFIGGSISQSGITADVSETFDHTYRVKAGDAITFLVGAEGNDAWDGGKLEVFISPAENGEKE